VATSWYGKILAIKLSLAAIMIVIDAYHQAISQKIAIPPIKDKEICNDGYGCDCERLHVVDCKNAFLQKDSF
jgi:hypothetical protein